MPQKLIDGDYARDEATGRVLRVEEIEALLQNAFCALNAKRGRFYPNKDFGSGIRELTAMPTEEHAFAFAVQALAGIDGVTVKSAAETQEGITLTLLLNQREGQVTIRPDDDV